MATASRFATDDQLAAQLRALSGKLKQDADRLDYLATFNEMMLTSTRTCAQEAARIADLLDPPPLAA